MHRGVLARVDYGGFTCSVNMQILSSLPQTTWTIPPPKDLDEIGLNLLIQRSDRRV